MASRCVNGSRTDLIKHLKEQTFKIGTGGFVRLIDVMGSDEAIVQAARVSYGAGTKKTSDDRALIRYLLRNRHTTPLEMCEVKLHVRVPMDTWRQWIRHRTASVNEYSTRYSEAIDQMHTADEWRLQSQTNKQGSQDGSLDWPPGHPWASNQTLDLTPSDYLSAKEHEFQRRAKALYTERLKFGVAREQARKDLPLSTYTEAYWKIDLHNLLHFLGLRMDSHAQQEIREYANVIGNEIVSHLFPMSWEAFEEYNLYGMQLSRSEVAVIADIIDDLREMTDANYGHMLRDGLGRERISESSATPKAWKGVRSRERDEFIEKATRLNLVRDSDG